MTLSLAFLSPALTKAAVEGRLPRGIGLEHLRELPLEWKEGLYVVIVRVEGQAPKSARVVLRR